jgi:hypothetical protein
MENVVDSNEKIRHWSNRFGLCKPRHWRLKQRNIAANRKGDLEPGVEASAECRLTNR